MAVKCPNCGSAVKDEGKFCSYCGAKLPDDTKRVEVKIDNTAEIKRAEYEEQESLLRQKKMKHDLAKEKRRPYIILAKVLSFVIPGALAATGWLDPTSEVTCVGVAIVFFAVWFVQFLSKL